MVMPHFHVLNEQSAVVPVGDGSVKILVACTLADGRCVKAMSGGKVLWEAK